MSKYITEAQIREIEDLANDGHAEAIVAAMSDLYNRGLVAGGIAVTVGIVVGTGIEHIVKALRSRKNKEAREES